ncbi:MAG: hypothetical protein AAGH67_09305 [Cyanobacteria bacterium P01_H01_bin.162]
MATVAVLKTVLQERVVPLTCPISGEKTPDSLARSGTVMSRDRGHFPSAAWAAGGLSN